MDGVDWYQLGRIAVTLSLFGASMYQLYLFRSQMALSYKPVLAFSVNVDNKDINLHIKNIGNGLARYIELDVRQHGGPPLKDELKVTHNGLAKDQEHIVNDWQIEEWHEMYPPDFPCSIHGTMKDIVGNTHRVDEEIFFGT